MAVARFSADPPPPHRSSSAGAGRKRRRTAACIRYHPPPPPRPLPPPPPPPPPPRLVTSAARATERRARAGGAARRHGAPPGCTPASDTATAAVVVGVVAAAATVRMPFVAERRARAHSRLRMACEWSARAAAPAAMGRGRGVHRRASACIRVVRGGCVPRPPQARAVALVSVRAALPQPRRAAAQAPTTMCVQAVPLAWAARTAPRAASANAHCRLRAARARR